MQVNKRKEGEMQRWDGRVQSLADRRDNIRRRHAVALPLGCRAPGVCWHRPCPENTLCAWHGWQSLPEEVMWATARAWGASVSQPKPPWCSPCLGKGPRAWGRWQQCDRGSGCLWDCRWFNDSSQRMRSCAQPPCFPLPYFVRSFDLVA